MSCDDVCIDMGCDEPNDFYSETRPRALKGYVCCECGQPIQAGEQYERASGKSDGEVWTVKTCAVCADIRKALVCGGWYFGHLWDAIENSVFPVATERSLIDCLAEIESLAARDRLRARFEAWRREAAS